MKFPITRMVSRRFFPLHGCALALVLLGLTACGGSGSGSKGTTPAAIPAAITAFELLDPTSAANDRFGHDVAVLGNGNIVVSDPFDSSVVTGGGAVHLYDPVTKTVIASIYGDNAGDNLGSGGLGFGGVFELANNNYVIVSPLDDGVAVDTGSVQLMNGATGVQIDLLEGDLANDQLGAGGVTELANGNFLIVSPFDNEGPVNFAGSVRLMDGTTGAAIGTAIIGDSFNDSVGSGGVIELDNGNYVIVSSFDTEGGVLLAGSVRLIDGTTGAQIGITIAGDVFFDAVGAGGVTPLTNGNYVILSILDDVGGVVDAGSMMLVNGATGVQIGATIAGDVLSDQLGFGLSEALSNGNFVFGSQFDDEGGIVDAGSVRLIDGTTGLQIGATFAGNTASEQAGLVTAIDNGNYVITSPFADVGGTVDVGTVQLMNGTTGVQIGATIEGDVANDQLGFGSVVGLANDNYLISSVNDDVGGVVDAGSVMLVNGATGVQIGTTIAGDAAGDQLGLGTVVVLENNNFVLGSSLDNEGGFSDAGSARLIDGTTGMQIGATLAGNTDGDQLGNLDIVPLANSSYVLLSSLDDEGGVVDAGSARLVNGVTGAQIGTAIVGGAANDMDEAVVSTSSTGEVFVLGLNRSDNNALTDSGRVLLVTE